MNRIVAKTILAGTALFMALSMNLSAQQQVFMEFHAQLKDIDENPIVNDSCQVRIMLHDLETGDLLFLTEAVTGTDSDGWLSIDFGKQAVGPDMKFELMFSPVENTTWLEAGEKFSIYYTFDKGSGMNGIQLSRSDGSELEMITVDGASLFTDTYPFAYIQSGFLFSKGPKPEQVLALRQKIDKSYELPSRGVKGGFAVGGYNKQ